MGIAKILVTVGRYVTYATLFIAATALLCWPLLKGLLPTPNTGQLAGLLIGIIGGVVVDFHKAISALRPNAGSLEHVSISDGIRLAVSGQKRIKHLRVFASTTEVILPIIRDCGLSIDLCSVMVQNFDSGTDPKSAQLKAKCESFINTWKDMQTQGIIGQLVINKYDFTPGHYYTIFDEHTVVFGLFCPVDLQTHAVDYVNPCLVNDTTPAGKLLISKYIQQFNHLLGRYQASK